MKDKLMPLRSIAALGEDLIAATKVNQLKQLHAINSMLGEARNSEKFLNSEDPLNAKSNFKNEYILSFENFKMLPFDPDSELDYQEYANIIFDPEIMKTVSVFNREIPTKEQAKKTYEALTEVNRLSPIPLSYKVISNDGDLMGLIMSAVLEKDEGGKVMVVDSGHLFKKKYGHYALSVGSVLIKQCFKNANCAKMVVSALSDNYNAQAVILRLGFKHVGQVNKKEGELLINVFEISKGDFFSNESKKVRIHDLRNYIDSMSRDFSRGDFTQPFCTKH